MRLKFLNDGSNHPSRFVWALIAAQMVFWTLIPTLTSSSLPLDVVREGLSWGQEWQWGYHKHPPLPSWLANVFYLGFGNLGPYLLSQICISLTYYYTYQTAKYHFSSRDAALAVILLVGVFYFSWPTPEFNHNVAQMPIWAGAIYVFHRVLAHERTLDWALLGLIFGIGVLVKYSIIVLAVVMAVYALATPRFRPIVLSPKSWPKILLSICCGLLVIFPHVLWLFRNDFLPLHYLSERSEAPQSLAERFLAPLNFSLAQALDHLPLLLIVFFSGSVFRGKAKGGDSEKMAPAFPRALLFWLGLGPLIATVVVAIAIGAGLRDMWGAPMWSLSGAMTIALLQDRLTGPRRRRLLVGSSSLFLAVVTLFGVNGALGGQVRDKPLRTDWPAKAIAQSFQTEWYSRTNCPLEIVAGDNWLAGLISYKAEGRPSVWIDGDLKISPWISEAEVAQKGALVVWEDTGPDRMAPVLERLSQREGFVHQEPVRIAWPKTSHLPPLVIDWAILPPAQGCKINRP